MPTDGEGELPSELEHWVSGNRLPVRVDNDDDSEKEVALTVEGIIELREKVKEAIDQWVQEGGERRRSLQALLRGKGIEETNSLAFQAVWQATRMKKLLEIKNLSEGLKQTLSAAVSVLEDDLLPSLGLSEKEKEKLDRLVEAELSRSEEKKGAYQERAQRLLSGERRQTDKTEEGRQTETQTAEGKADQKDRQRRSQRAQHLLEVLARKGALEELPAILFTDLVELASEVNTIRLAQKLEEVRVDLSGVKARVAQLMQEMPEQVLVKNGEEMTREYREWLKGLLATVAEVTNVVHREFKHRDDVYLTSQVLETDLANCAGKSLMTARLLKWLGLDMVYEQVAVRLDSDHAGEHVEMGLRLPGGVYVQLDMIYPVVRTNISKSSEQLSDEESLLDKFDHNAAVLVLTDEGVDMEERRQVAGDEFPQVVVVNGYRARVVEEVAHKIVSFGEELPWVEMNNLAVLLTNNHWVFVGVEALMEAEYLFRRALEANPESPLVMTNLARLLTLHHYFFEEGALREAEDLLQKALEVNPVYVQASYELALLWQRRSGLGRT